MSFISGFFRKLFSRNTQPVSENVNAPGVDACFAHHTEFVIGADPVASPFTPEILEVLGDILASPLGARIVRHVVRSGTRIPIALSEGPDVAFSVIEKTLYYTTDLAGYLASREHNIAHTLGTLMAHSLGYVIENLEGMTIPEEGVHVTRHCENVYREYKDMPLRCTYLAPGDVC
ncbi:MAG: hypothetical protein KY410_09385 [Proteobacteria bacterium]|nr:hypothetical protein [Pseudomonadota bacterium]